MWRGRRIGCGLTVALVLGAWAPAARAATLTFGYAGVIDSVGDGADDDSFGFTSVVEPGTAFTGTFTFDPAAADSIAAPSAGAYAASVLTLSLAGQTFTFPAGVAIATTNGFSSLGPGDEYLVGASDASATLSLRFTDLAGTLFDSDALPTVPFPLDGLVTFLFLQASTASDTLDVNGSISSLTCEAGCEPTPVPEPGMLALLAIGLGTLRSGRRR
jgi:hypothetical protein